MIPGSRESVAATDLRLAPLSASVKLAFVAAFLGTGTLAAIAFHRSTPPADIGDEIASLSATVTRRLDERATSNSPRAQTPFRLAADSEPYFRPPIAATGLAPVDVAVLPQPIERSVSPVGALLQPVECEPAPAEPKPNVAGPELADPHAGSETKAADSKPRTHRVADGDTLRKLAVEYLGSGERYLEIFAVNRETLKTPDLLPIGVTLKIPPRAAKSAMNDSRITPIPPDAWRPAK